MVFIGELTHVLYKYNAKKIDVQYNSRTLKKHVIFLKYKFGFKANTPK